MAILDMWKAHSACGRYKGWTADNSELAAELQEAFDNATANGYIAVAIVMQEAKIC